MAAPVPDNEAERLARVQALAVLDTASEPLFDALTQTAAAVTGAPIALMTLVDSQRQWFKASVGVGETDGTAREHAFCAHTILDDEIFEVADTQTDPRFADNPLVLGELDVRFYAGAPIVLGEGVRVGALCVIDHTPRQLDASQREVLRQLARAASEALVLRQLAAERQVALARAAALATRRLQNAQLLQAKLRASTAFLNRSASAAGLGGWELDLLSNELTWTDETCRIHELAPGYKPTLAEAMAFYPPDAREQVSATMKRAVAEGNDWDLEVPFTTATGRHLWVRSVGSAEYNDSGQPVRLIGAFQDISIRRRVVSALEASERRFRKLFQYSLGLIFTHDYEGVLLSANPAAAQSLGYAVGELLGRPLSDLMPPERQALLKQYLVRIITHDTDEGTIVLIAKSGEQRVWHYRNILDDEGEDPYVLGHAQDVTESYTQARRLQELSIRDPLTGCFNRRYLSQLVAGSSGQRWGCVAVDLDHFKQVNDTYGHQRGDEVLIATAEFLRGHVRAEDAVIRLGGDEFLLLLHDADAALTADIVARVETHRDNAPIAFTLGTATFGDEVSLEQGLADADQRLYQRRESERSRVS